jgi:hypothetical protein
MGLFGQVGNPTNISDQNMDGVFGVSDLEHGIANDFLEGRTGRFQILDTGNVGSVSDITIQRGFNQSDIIEVEFIDIAPSTDNQNLQVQFFESGVLESASVYDRAYNRMDSSNTNTFTISSSASSLVIADGVGNATYEAVSSACLTMFGHNTSNGSTQFFYKSVYLNASGNVTSIWAGGELPQASTVDGIKVFFSSGQSKGQIKMFGYE